MAAVELIMSMTYVCGSLLVLREEESGVHRPGDPARPGPALRRGLTGRPPATTAGGPIADHPFGGGTCGTGAGCDVPVAEVPDVPSCGPLRGPVRRGAVLRDLLRRRRWGRGRRGRTDRPSVTGSPTRTLPSPTRSVSVPEQSESEPASPRPSRSPALSPGATRTSEPNATTTSEPEPEPTSAEASPSTSPAEEEGGGGSADESASTTTWVALVLLVVLAMLGTWLMLRSRRRRVWSTRLQVAEAEVAWFARDLIPQLRASASAEQVAGGWQVARPRIASAEDQLTVLESSAPGEQETERARLLRDAVRSARLRTGPADWPRRPRRVGTGAGRRVGPPRAGARTAGGQHPGVILREGPRCSPVRSQITRRGRGTGRSAVRRWSRVGRCCRTRG